MEEIIKNEYFSNIYRKLLTNKYLHIIITILDYFIILIVQLDLVSSKFIKVSYNPNKILNISSTITNIFALIATSAKIVILIIICILIISYYLVLTNKKLKENVIFYILINFFEIFIFRLLIIFYFSIIFSFTQLILFLSIILNAFIVYIIIKNFLNNHLYYFVPDFMIFPYDSYSSLTDTFNTIIKFVVALAIQIKNTSTKRFLYLISIICQFIIFFISCNIFLYKSYYIMNNILLNKVRFSLISGTVIIHFITLIIKTQQINEILFLIVVINIFIFIFISIYSFYDPYNQIRIDTNENIENIYNYFFIISHNRNKHYILEEKLEKHFLSCGKCKICKKLQKYSISKTNNNILYKIIYNNHTTLSKTINDIIRNIIIYGKQTLQNNSYYLINIIHNYYIALSRNNIVLSLNLKILYEVINNENKNFIDNHLLSTQQIKLINEFLEKAEGVVDEIADVLNEKRLSRKLKKIFSLSKRIYFLNEKKFKNGLYYNKSEGIINFVKYISICTMIYEELFNTTISNSGISLKDNYIFLEDLTNKNYNHLNQIVIEFNVLNMESKIIYITGDLSKFRNKPLCQLFPNLFKNKQLSIIKNTILNSKIFSSGADKDKNNTFNSNKKYEKQFVNIKCIILDDNGHKKLYKMMKLKLSLIYSLNMSKKVLFSGIYSLDENLIITLDKSNMEKRKECVINNEDENENIKNYNNEGNSENSSTTKLVRIKKREKYYKNQKMIFLLKYIINPNVYNVYHILQKRDNKNKNSSSGETANGKNNLVTNNSNTEVNSSSKFDSNIKGGMNNGNIIPSINYNLFSDIQSQTSASTFYPLTSQNQNFKKKNKNGNSSKNKKLSWFKYYQYFLFLNVICIIIIFLVIFLYLKKLQKKLEFKNNTIIILKEYHLVFNMLFTSTLLLSCISTKANNDTNCLSNIKMYETIYENFVGKNFSCSKLLYYKNKYYSNRLNDIRYKIFELIAVNDDAQIAQQFNRNMSKFHIIQEFEQDGVKISAHIDIDNFINMLELVTSSFTILFAEESSYDDILYIINGDNPKNDLFQNVLSKQSMTTYQNYFYFVLLNYNFIVQNINIVSFSFIINIAISMQRYLKIVYVICALYLFCIIIVSIIIFFYLDKYNNMLADLIGGIMERLSIKYDDLSVRELLKQKIDKLKIIISLYKQDLYQAIVDINFIYDNYRKFIEKKNKELSKFNKREKNTNSNNYRLSILSISDDKKKQRLVKPEHIRENNNSKKYYYILFIIVILAIILSLYILYLWVTYNYNSNNLQAITNVYDQLLSNLYILMNYYQLMYYNNLTLNDINNYLHYNTSLGENVFNGIYSNIKDLYDAKKGFNTKYASSYKSFEQYFKFSCENFVKDIIKKNEAVQYIQENMINENISNFYLNSCEMSGFFTSSDFHRKIQLLLEYIQIGINEVNDHSYDGLIKGFKEFYLGKITAFYSLLYDFIFNFVDQKIQKPSIIRTISILGTNTNTTFILFLVFSIVLLLVIYLFYIKDVDKNYHMMHDLRKVWKVCNKKE